MSCKRQRQLKVHTNEANIARWACRPIINLAIGSPSLRYSLGAWDRYVRLKRGVPGFFGLPKF